MIGTPSPWSEIETVETLWDDGKGRSAYFVTTASHGGIKLSLKLENEMPEYLKSPRHTDTGWYEEDCEWSLVFIQWPGMFWHQGDATRIEPLRKAAHATLKHYYPEAVTLYNRHHIGQI